MASSTSISIWRGLTFAGAILVAVGQGGMLLDFTERGGSRFIVEHTGLFMLAIPAGILLVFIGAIGWAKHLIRGHRIAMALAVFIVPLAVCILIGLFVGANVHGPFFLFALPLAPALILSLILLLMAAFAKN